MGSNSCGPKKPCVRWVKVGQIHSPTRRGPDGDATVRQNSLTTCFLIHVVYGIGLRILGPIYNLRVRIELCPKTWT